MDCQSSSQSASGAVDFRLAAGVVVLLLCALGLLSCRSVDWFLVKRSLRSKFSDVQWITTAELADWLAAKDRPQPVLLDVRTRAEWRVSHLPEARLVDPKTDPKTAVERLPKNAPIVTYCAIGYRSGAVARRLRALGYTHVQNLEGSIFEWANEHRPLVHNGKPVTRVHPYSPLWVRLLQPDMRAPLPE
ncbi:MAG: rhodanese-like domain-containing protein [Chthoniobacterales bacterium]